MIVRGLVIAIAVLVALLTAQTWRLHLSQLALASERQASAELTAEIAEQRANAEAAARATEQAQRAEMDRIGAEHARALEAAQDRADSVAADLRAGTLRLRREWAQCETDRLVSEASESAGSADAGAELRAAGAAHLVRLGAQCDAWVRGLQQAVRTHHAN